MAMAMSMEKYCRGDGIIDVEIVIETEEGSTNGGKRGSGSAIRITSGRNGKSVSGGYGTFVTAEKNKIN